MPDATARVLYSEVEPTQVGDLGHLRLGRLPKTHRWNDVVGLLDTAPFDTPAIAQATVHAAEEQFVELARDPALVYCFWLLTRIASASRGGDFLQQLHALGIDVHPGQPTLAVIPVIADRVREDTSPFRESGPFGDLAALALRRALGETVGERTPSLFGSTIDDLQNAFRAYASAKQFGVLSRRFFGDFFARSLGYFLDKELSNVVGDGRAIANIARSREFSDALDLYTRQSARIMEDFASGWYSKHNWESHGAISRKEAQGFVAVALRKLRQELSRDEIRS